MRLLLLTLLVLVPTGCTAPTAPTPPVAPEISPIQLAALTGASLAQELDIAGSEEVGAPPAPPSEPPAPEPCPPPEERRLQVAGRGEVVRGDPAVPVIALTFDAGAGSGAIHELLDVLRDRGVPSTFFVAGAFADRYPDIVARIAEEGHELANHSYTHPDFRTLSDQQMRVELRRGTQAIERAAGGPIAPLWRPPFGGRDDRVLRVVEEEGFRSIYWTFDSGDWIEGTTAARIINTDLRRAVNGAVVVHHVSPVATARAMPTTIDELRRQGYKLVTVSELMGYRADCLPKLG